MDDTKQAGSLTKLVGWFAHPFSSDMSALQWFLFLGLVACISVFWHQVFRHIKE